MGKLIKNHWARLIILTAAAYQVAASISGFFWPKLFWDFLTTNLDHAVRPVPILQILNLLLGLLGLCWEWPLPLFTTAATSTRLHNNHTAATTNPAISYSHASQKPVTTTASSRSAAPPPNPPNRLTTLLAAMHRSIEARLLIYPLSSLASLLLYQGTNAGIYYIIGMGVYFWGFSEGEVVMGVPWTLPRRRKRAAGMSRV
ncbi:hypothetical protein BDR22DRAFT_427451 [Usnea florida]